MAPTHPSETPEDLAVFISTRDDNTCKKCACRIERGDLMFPVEGQAIEEHIYKIESNWRKAG